MSENPIIKPNNLKSHLKAFGLAALMVFSPLMGLELLLQVFDPWGIRFYEDLGLYWQAVVDDELRGFVLPDGVYQYTHWEATIVNATRYTPNTPESAECRIVLLGDSTTFGYGVNDDETWANLIAAEFPEIQFANAGLTAYTSANVLGSWQSFPNADYYVYLSNPNDWEPSVTQKPTAYRPGDQSLLMPFIARYGNYIYNRSRILDQIVQGTAEDLLILPQYQRYFEDMQALDAVENMSIITWDNNFLKPGLDSLGIDYQETAILSGYDISAIDKHYNVEGNRVFAQNLKPLFETIVSEACS